MISELPLAFITMAFFAAGLLCGLVTWLLLRGTHLDAGVAFGWGAVLGPIGIGVAAVLVWRWRRDTALSSPAPW
jgi:hypothetical protein